MRLREFLMSTALMSLALLSAKASPLSLFNHEIGDDFVSEHEGVREPDPSVSIPADPSPLIAEDKVLRAAYYDTLSILSTNNLCSDFFGGPALSIEAFTQFVGRMRKDHLSGGIAMRMTGETTNVRNDRTKKQYRLFEKVSINANGPFYRSRFSTTDPAVPPIGTFEPNTKEVRVLIFLHELGHLIKGEDGAWLLPNDGHSDNVSKLNTRKIEGVCGTQIKGLGKSESRTLIAELKHASENMVSQGTKP
ncbi:MAG: hypothetical protein M3R67_08785 [Acidobacteriota bacterium]|nr:hypothetical protein [Acidobacteriota bacterium]